MNTRSFSIYLALFGLGISQMALAEEQYIDREGAKITVSGASSLLSSSSVHDELKMILGAVQNTLIETIQKHPDGAKLLAGRDLGNINRELLIDRNELIKEVDSVIKQINDLAREQILGETETSGLSSLIPDLYFVRIPIPIDRLPLVKKIPANVRPYLAVVFQVRKEIGSLDLKQLTKVSGSDQSAPQISPCKRTDTLTRIAGDAFSGCFILPRPSIAFWVDVSPVNSHYTRPSYSYGAVWGLDNSFQTAEDFVGASLQANPVKEAINLGFKPESKEFATLQKVLKFFPDGFGSMYKGSKGQAIYAYKNFSFRRGAEPQEPADAPAVATNSDGPISELKSFLNGLPLRLTGIVPVGVLIEALTDAAKQKVDDTVGDIKESAKETVEASTDGSAETSKP